MLSVLAVLLITTSQHPASPHSAVAGVQLEGHLVCSEPLDLGGIEVRIWETRPDGETQVVRTDAAGNFSAPREPTRPAWILVRDHVDASGQTWSAARHWARGESGEPRVELRRGDLLYGRAVGNGDRWLERALLHIASYPAHVDLGESVEALCEVLCDEHGAFARAGLPRGLYRLGGQSVPDSLAEFHEEIFLDGRAEGWSMRPGLTGIREDIFRLPLRAPVMARAIESPGVSGIVLDPQGKPVADALVVADVCAVLAGWRTSVRATSDEAGRFDIGPLTAAHTCVRAWSPGFAMSAAWHAQLGEGEAATDVVLVLRPAAGASFELVSERLPQERILAIRYTQLYWEDESAPWQALSKRRAFGDVQLGPDGRVQIADVPAGIYWIQCASPADFSQGKTSSVGQFIELRAGQTRRVVVGASDPAPFTARGRFVPEPQARLPELELYVSVPDAKPVLQRRVPVRADGSYEVELPLSGRYEFRGMRKSGSSVRTWELDVSVDFAHVPDLRWPGGTIRGVVLAGEPPAPSAAYIQVDRIGSPGAGEPRCGGGAPSQPDTGFVVEDLPPAKYRLRAEQWVEVPGGGTDLLRSAWQEVDVSGGKPVESLRFVLRPVEETARFGER